MRMRKVRNSILSVWALEYESDGLPENENGAFSEGFRREKGVAVWDPFFRRVWFCPKGRIKGSFGVNWVKFEWKFVILAKNWQNLKSLARGDRKFWNHEKKKQNKTKKKKKQKRSVWVWTVGLVNNGSFAVRFVSKTYGRKLKKKTNKQTNDVHGLQLRILFFFHDFSPRGCTPGNLFRHNERKESENEVQKL